MRRPWAGAISGRELALEAETTACSGKPCRASPVHKVTLDMLPPVQTGPERDSGLRLLVLPLPRGAV